MIENKAFENKYPLFFKDYFLSSIFIVKGLSTIGYAK